MSDHLLFVVAPYVAALVFVSVCLVRYVLWRRRPDRGTTQFAGGDGLVGAAWRSALVVVGLGHLLAFAFPDYLLLWNRQLFRLVVLEGSGVIAGSLALAGLLATFMRPLRASHRFGARPPVDVIAATLVLVAMMSGVGIAVIYRWASSWSEVTLGPYLYSLARLEPSTYLVTGLPVVVKLHVFCAFAILAVSPFTQTVRSVILPVDRLTRRTLAPVSAILRPAWYALEERTTVRAQALRAKVLGSGAEEN